MIFYPPLFLIGVAFAVGKEIYDLKIGKPFDMMDMTFTMLGVFAMIGFWFAAL